jgi:hypothetical protein
LRRVWDCRGTGGAYCQLVAERNDLELQNRAAVKPTSEPGEERRDDCEHAGDTTAGQDKSLDFSTLSEFLVGTGVGDTDKSRLATARFLAYGACPHPRATFSTLRNVHICPDGLPVDSLQIALLWRYCAHMAPFGPPLLIAGKTACIVGLPREGWRLFAGISAGEIGGR